MDTTGLLILYIALPVIPLVSKISLESIIYDRLQPVRRIKSWSFRQAQGPVRQLLPM